MFFLSNVQWIFITSTFENITSKIYKKIGRLHNLPPYGHFLPPAVLTFYLLSFAAGLPIGPWLFGRSETRIAHEKNIKNYKNYFSLMRNLRKTQNIRGQKVSIWGRKMTYAAGGSVHGRSGAGVCILLTLCTWPHKYVHFSRFFQLLVFLF